MGRKKGSRPIGDTIGGILVGFDQQVFRTLPPAHELGKNSRPVRGLSGKDDGLRVVFPGEEHDDDAPAAKHEEEPRPDGDV